MALEHSCSWDNIGYEHPEAYARVVNVDIDRQVDVAKIKVEVFHNKAAREDGTSRPIVVKIMTCKKEVEIEDGDPFETFFGYDVMNEKDMNETKAGYLYVKTTPDYKDWEAC